MAGKGSVFSCEGDEINFWRNLKKYCWQFYLGQCPFLTQIFLKIFETIACITLDKKLATRGHLHGFKNCAQLLDKVVPCEFITTCMA